jgi:hypothetical protein
MNWTIFAFFYVIAFIWMQSDGGWWFYNITIALFLSPLLAMASFAVYGVITKLFDWLGKSKPKDGWWKDKGGY